VGVRSGLVEVNKEKTNPLAIPLKAKSKADKSKTVNTNQLKHSK